GCGQLGRDHGRHHLRGDPDAAPVPDRPPLHRLRPGGGVDLAMSTNPSRTAMNASSITRRGLLGGAAALAAVPLVGCTEFGVGYSQPSGSVPGEFANRLRIVFWSAFTGDNLPILAGLIDRFNRSQT